jgi:hypothetical protein
MYPVADIKAVYYDIILGSKVLHPVSKKVKPFPCISNCHILEVNGQLHPPAT